MDYYFLEFSGVSCPGCVTAIERKIKSLDYTKIKNFDKSSGNTIIESGLTKMELSEMMHSFQGCCANCQIYLKNIHLNIAVNNGFTTDSNDGIVLIKKQYKRALEQMIDKKEVSCSDYCVCKTTNVDRLEEFSDAPSFSSIYNLANYLQDLHILSPQMSVIDFGCGTGHDAFQISSIIKSGNITGIDATPEMVDFAKQTALKLNITNAFFHESDNLLSISLNSQDLVILNNVFNILVNKKDIIIQTNQILKSNALLVIADEFIVDDLPDLLREDPVFQCGGIAGAKSFLDIKTMIVGCGFTVKYEKIVRSYTISYNQEEFKLTSGIIIFQKKNDE